MRTRYNVMLLILQPLCFVWCEIWGFPLAESKLDRGCSTIENQGENLYLMKEKKMECRNCTVRETTLADRGSRFLRNAVINIPDQSISQPRIPHSTNHTRNSTTPWTSA